MTIEAMPSESSLRQDPLWHAGRADGEVGQTWLEHERILREETERERSEEIATRELRRSAAEADAAVTKSAYDLEEKNYLRFCEQNQNAVEDRDKNPAQYSRAVGLVFCVLAVAIVAADYPLSRAIANEILQKAPEWESWSVAAGIVAMGLFFKILADPFMRPRYLFPRGLRTLNWGVTVVFALLIAVALALVLGLLGIFRGNTLRTQQAPDEDTTFQAASSSPAPRAPAPGTLEKMQRDLDSLQMGFISQVAFLALGLVLPILGGIFAATGIARWHNQAHINRLQRELPVRQESYRTALQRMNQSAASLASVQKELELLSKRPTDGGRRYHVYLHGYESGLCSVRAVEGGISEAVLSFVRRWLTIARQRENLLRSQRVAVANQDRPVAAAANGATT